MSAPAPTPSPALTPAPSLAPAPAPAHCLTTSTFPTYDLVGHNNKKAAAYL